MSLGPAASAGADETGLVAASRAGDPDAFSDLVRLHQRRVFRLAGRFFRKREDVEDVAQETFLTAWRKLATYKAKAPFEHWITRVCLNCCYGRLRRQKPATFPIEQDVEARSADPDARIEVERLLRELKPGDRFLLLLLDGEGWSVAEIATRLGWTAVNVKVRAHRARKKLRRLLERGS
jgi:RNA polymerase sigma-70 factor (ECF subfamily)